MYSFMALQRTGTISIVRISMVIPPKEGMAIGAKSFRNSNNGSFYYDASLRNGGLNLTGSKFVVKRWSENSSFSNP